MDVYLHFVITLGILSKNDQTFSNIVDIFRIISTSTFVGTRWTTKHLRYLRFTDRKIRSRVWNVDHFLIADNNLDIISLSLFLFRNSLWNSLEKADI